MQQETALNLDDTLKPLIETGNVDGFLQMLRHVDGELIDQVFTTSIEILVRSSSYSPTHQGMLQACLDRGANVNAIAFNGYPIIVAAIRWGSTDLVRLLVENSACLEVVERAQMFGSYQTSALIEALRANKTEALPLIRDHSPLEGADDMGRTPLFFAVESGNIDMVRFLLEEGVNVHARTLEQCSIFHYLPWDKPETAQTLMTILLECTQGEGADLSNEDGFTPAEMAPTFELREVFTNCRAQFEAHCQATALENSTSQALRQGRPRPRV